MTQSNIDKVLGASSLVPKVLWFAMLGAVAVLTYVAFTAAHVEGSATIHVAGELPLQLSIMAGGLALAVLWLRSRIVSGKGLSGAQQATQSASEEQKIRAKAAQLLPPFILALALSESITVLGFVLAFASKDPEAIVPFAAGSATLILSLFPNLPAWVRRGLGVN